MPWNKRNKDLFPKLNANKLYQENVARLLWTPGYLVFLVSELHNEHARYLVIYLVAKCMWIKMMDGKSTQGKH